jgi:glycosyltransferase involved in cell wall biosynthesis
MKIVYFAHSVLSRGGDKMVLAHANHLAEAGHDVVIMTNVLDTVFNIHSRIKIERLKFNSKIGTVFSAIFEKTLSDCVLVSIIPMAFLLSFRNRGKIVYFAQDYNESLYYNPLQRMFIRFLYVITLSIFKVRTIAVSEQLADHLKGNFNANAKVIQNGIDFSTFFPEPSIILNKSKNGRKAILFFSRRDHRKGFDLALKTISNILSSTDFPIEIWTVGDPLLDGEVTCLHQDFGYVIESEMRRLLSSADLFLYPSRSEGFGIMVLEAFACRCPVVTTDAIPFAIDEENALVARIEDVEGLVARVTRILADQELSRKLTDTAAEFVLKYSLKSSVEEFESTLVKTGSAKC